MLKNLRNYYKQNLDTRSLLAFLASFLLHLCLLLYLVWDFQKEDTTLTKYGNQEKEHINIRDFKFVPPPSKQNENLVAQKPLKEEPPIKKQPIARKKEEKPKEKKIKTADSRLAPQKVETKPQEQDLPKSMQEILPKDNPPSPSIYSLGKNISNPPTKETQELYGEDWYLLNAEERQFLEDNLKAIGKITQSYLKYPRLAGRTGQQGRNIIEFYLYPNGNISDLKLLTSSGYALLDNNSERTIEIAYKDYPYPSVKTKIRIQIYYHIH